MSERIFLIGFMGTGKTTVGAVLADVLQWNLVDSDQEIVKREGREIPAIFSAEGEAYFRRMESKVLLELAQRPQTVITTGGGAVLAPRNRQLMQQTGLVVRLHASIEEIVRRVSSDANRPLLQADDLRARVEQLLQERQGLYDFAQLTIDTTGREIADIVQEIVRHWSATVR